MNVLILNGPNLASLGTREPEIYGTRTLDDIAADLAPIAAERGVVLRWFQSNHEGALIDELEARRDWAHGGLMNAGALTHYSRALADAVRAFGKPVIEVHLSDITAREPWRRVSVFEDVRAGEVHGRGADAYRIALLELVRLLADDPRRDAR